MLPLTDNELLTRVGPGTPMGRLLRQYWMPAALSSELAEPDGAPLRVRFLGEDLIAFRATSGRVGLLAEGCPHRGASLYLGRNEEEGLRCVYHGWKWGHDGRCLDMPNEPPGCRFEGKVRAVAYPCRERNGVVWAYMGPRADPPPLPDFEWNMLPDNVPFMWRNYRACNWMQALEGDVDSSHINFLHRTLDRGELSTVPGTNMPGHWNAQMALTRKGDAPRIEAAEAPFGALYSAARTMDDGREYHRVHPFLFPFHTMVGGGLDARTVSLNGKAWVPMDDTHTLALEWQLRLDAPWTDAERAELLCVRVPHGFLPPSSAPAGAWMPRAHAGNDYLLDRELQRSKLFLGVLSNPTQDAAVQESMGPIIDRSKEHLGPADAMIILMRRRLLAAARALAERGVTPPGVDEPALYRVRPVGAMLPAGADWRAATDDRRRAFAGVRDEGN